LHGRVVHPNEALLRNEIHLKFSPSLHEVRFAAAALGLFVAILSAQSPSPADTALQVIRPEVIRAHMRFLADDMLEGRGTGTRGYQLAANYVVAQFEALGLEPAVTHSSYFQPVPLLRATLQGASTSLVLTTGRTQRKLIF
jgi:hypothetical protein